MSYSIGSHFDAQRWYDTTIDKRTREALRSRIAEFELEHENDSDTELLILIRARANELGYVPYAVDCLAGHMIVQRFGSWINALRLAKLPKPRGSMRIRDSRLYQEEYRRQQKLHRIEKELKMSKRKSAERERKRRKKEQGR